MLANGLEFWEKKFSVRFGADLESELNSPFGKEILATTKGPGGKIYITTKPQAFPEEMIFVIGSE